MQLRGKKERRTASTTPAPAQNDMDIAFDVEKRSRVSKHRPVKWSDRNVKKLAGLLRHDKTYSEIAKVNLLSKSLIELF